MAREIKIVVDNNNTNPIFVVDDNIYVFTGNAAMIKKLEDATPVERECAIGPNSECDLAHSFKSEYENQNKNNENKGFDPTAYKVDNNYFDSAVNYLTRCSGEDFLELVAYAKKHGNTFFHCIREVADVINADDAYRSAIIQLTRHFGEPLENKAFNLFANIDNPTGEEIFLEFWKALQVINFIA